MKSFHIKPVLNGYTVDVECSTVVFTSKESLIENIKEYLEDPHKMESKYKKNSLNSKHFFDKCEPNPNYSSQPCPEESSIVGCDTSRNVLSRA